MKEYYFTIILPLWSFIILYLIVMMGCAVRPRSHSYDYPPFRIVIGDQSTVDRGCKEVDQWDTGEKRYSNQSVGGCWRHEDRVIFVPKNRLCALVHELGHVYGFPHDEILKDYDACGDLYAF